MSRSELNARWEALLKCRTCVSLASSACGKQMVFGGKRIYTLLQKLSVRSACGSCMSEVSC